MSELVRVEHLKKYFNTPSGLLHAVDDVSFSIEEQTTLGVVGESGCGKSTLGRVVLKLLDQTDGKIFYDGRDITHISEKENLELRKEMQIIFQDPYSSLNPRLSVMELSADPLRVFGHYKSAEREQKVYELMDMVGLARRFAYSYPHELDGGRRQRIGIARALSLNPKFIVCDEPVSALDVSIQAQILNLLKRLQKERGLTYIFITHDLSVIYYFADDIAVMYLGKLVEKAPAEELFAHPMHPYTRALLSAIPEPRLDSTRKRILLRGEITSPVNLPDECRFGKRCDYCCERCRQGDPELIEVSPNHFVACHYPLPVEHEKQS